MVKSSYLLGRKTVKTNCSHAMNQANVPKTKTFKVVLIDGKT